MSNESYVSEIIGELEAIAALSAEGMDKPVARVYVTDDDYDIEWLRPYSTGFLYDRPAPAAAATGGGWAADLLAADREYDATNLALQGFDATGLDAEQEEAVYDELCQRFDVARDRRAAMIAAAQQEPQ